MTDSTPNTTSTPIATLVLLLLWAWVVMTISHELGHVVGGTISGATLSAFEIRPWHLPYSLFSPDPNPLVTVWAGPMIGCALPLLIATCFRTPTIWLIAWFCVLANASYLLLGFFSGDGQLDSTKILKAGTPPIVLLLFIAMIGPVSYVAFRGQCIGLMSDPQRSLSKRCWKISALSLGVLLVLQAAVGTIISF